MTALRLVFAIALIGCLAPALTQDAESGAPLVREPRGHRRRCRKYGICGNQGFGGYQQGFGGYQQGYQGYPPAINIGISQSQSSASAGGGGYSSGYYPNNHQYNGFPNHGYGHQGGYGGYPNHGGYGGAPGFSNGQGGYNNQFNGNYYGPGAGNGGFGYPGAFQGGYFDEAENNDPANDGAHNELSEQEQNDQANFNEHSGSYGPQGPQEPHGAGQEYASSGAFAFAGRKNH